MTNITLSIFNPNTLLPHRAGIAGLALALSEIASSNSPIKSEVTEDAVILSWDCTDKEAIKWLLEQTYQIKDGYLNVPALKLDQQSRYIFSEGVVTTFLQHSKQRTLEKQSIVIILAILKMLLITKDNLKNLFLLRVIMFLV
jgi:hypothetical protein